MKAAETMRRTLSLLAAFLGEVCHKKFGRLRLVPISGLSAELL
jgi:hypothetical protein